jgi:hypothetical protein
MRGLRGVLGLVAAVFVSLAGSIAAPGALAAGDANEAVCPASTEASPGFRSYLPDCRAYEMVTPPFKSGYLFASLGIVAGAGGSRVLIETFGGVSSGDAPLGDGLTNYYDEVRTGSGWVTRPVAVPSLAQYDQSAGGAAAPLLSDTGAALMPFLHPVSGSVYVSNLYLRGADGSFVLVGPTVPPSAVPATPTGNGELELSLSNWGGLPVGATPDFSHVLFTLPPSIVGELPPGVLNGLWPGDTTVLLISPGESGMVSLYEYVGTGGSEPKLVGVSNEGPLVSDTEAHLVSQCGTFLGGSNQSGDKHNAVSVDGSSVFFTAVGTDHFNCGGVQPPVDELFARVDGSRTVAISEPSPDGGCTEPGCVANTGAAHEAQFRDANFEGASQDGSRVLFTSTQQLLNGASEDSTAGDSATQKVGTPGCSGTSLAASGCNLYLYDSGLPVGQRLVLVSGGDSSGEGPRVQGVGAVSEDGSHVYFVARGVLTGTASSEGKVAQSGAENLYVFERDARFPAGHTTFIASLAESDSLQWSSNAEHAMNVTGDGGFLVFTSGADLTPDDTSTVEQVFRYDAQADRLVRVSVGDGGFNRDGNTGVNPASIPSVNLWRVRTASMPLHPAVSEDGSVVAFASSDALTPQALEDPTNGVANVYEYRGGRVYLISDGREAQVGGEKTGGLEGVSPSGSDIFFTSSDPLVPQDVDSGQENIFDARVGGGFPAPVPPVGCEGDGCQGALAGAPSGVAPGSVVFSGPGNLAPAPATKIATRKKLARCHGGRRRVHGRCVRVRRGKVRGRKAGAGETSETRRAA